MFRAAERKVVAMIISIASGKGGTGKTTIATSLALSLEKVQLLDCDVEEPNAAIFLKPRTDKSVPVGIPVPEVDKDTCTFCRKCSEVCAYHALVVLPKDVLFFPELCHGCGGCAFVCPEKAIKEVPREIGLIETGRTNSLSYVQGTLNVGEPMATPLIRREKCFIDKSKTVIIDCPPGTSCPVIESVKGSDFCLLVTEPTPFGLNDLTLAVEMLRHLGIPFGVVINCYGIGDQRVEYYCGREKIPILLRLPWQRDVAEAYSRGITAVEAIPKLRTAFLNMYSGIAALLSRGHHENKRVH
jgi:MinD superfamily P-loop ATPase